MELCKSELEHLLERERMVKKICSELNNFTDLKSTMLSIVSNSMKMLEDIIDKCSNRKG